MAFFSSDLIKNLEKGELPTVKAEVTLPRKTLVDLGIMIMIVAVGITALVIVTRITK